MGVTSDLRIVRSNGRQHEEKELPCDRNADEPVEIFRMVDRRRKLAAQAILEEVQRHEHGQPIDSGGGKDAACECHGR